MRLSEGKSCMAGRRGKKGTALLTWPNRLLYACICGLEREPRGFSITCPLLDKVPVQGVRVGGYGIKRKSIAYH